MRLAAITLWLAPPIFWMTSAVAQTNSPCQNIPNPWPSSEGAKLEAPSYYFPSLKVTNERPAFPIALVVWRQLCLIDGSSTLWIRMTPEAGTKQPMTPIVTIVQDGVEKGWFGPTSGSTGGFAWYYGFNDFGRLPDAGRTASLYTTRPFDSHRAFTLKLRYPHGPGTIDSGWTASTPDLIFEIPARGVPGNVIPIPEKLAGLWWNPGEPGSGLILDRNQRGAVYAAWLTYDDNGDSTWFVMTNSRPSADGGVEGAAYTLRGQPFTQPQLDTAFDAEVVGRFHLKFTDASNGEFNFQVNGRSGRMPIRRFETACKESVTRNVQQVDGLIGWGANLEGNPFQPECGLHATLLTYDDEGKPMMVFGGLLETIKHSLHVQGAIYRPRGTPYGLPADPSRFVVGPPVGDWESVPSSGFPKQMRININGVSRTLDLSRFYFEY